MMKLPAFSLILMLLAISSTVHADAYEERARELLERYPLIDGHNDLPWVIREHGGDVEGWDLQGEVPGDTNIPGLKTGGVGGQFWSVYIPATESMRAEGFAKTQLEQLDIARRVIAKYPDTFMMATSAAELEAAREQGKIGSLFGVEGGHAIENSLGALRMYYDLGARYMTLTHSQSNDWADATGFSEHNGLTDFGRDVVREMNRLGMLVDLSHVSPKVMHDALDVASAPVIFSHSNAYALTPHPRNVPDDVLARLPENGGVVMLSFVDQFNSPGYAGWDAGFKAYRGDVKWGDKDFEDLQQAYSKANPLPGASIADVADHIEYIASTAGYDHVGIGADLFGEPDWMVDGLGYAHSYPQLFAELLRRGWSEANLAKLSRENVLRALRGAEQAAVSAAAD